MSSPHAQPFIRLRGVRHNNLKNFDLDLPAGKLIVVTGLSGSGKSSLAFDTIFAEGQRRYIETFSPYARQFFDRMDKPQVDRIEGIPPAIAIEQRNTVKSTRSTVGTMTEICDHMKLLWPQLAGLYCRKCGQLVRKDSPQSIWQTLGRELSERPQEKTDVLVTFELPLSDKLPLGESLALIAKQGYQRLWHGRGIVRLDEALAVLGEKPPDRLTVVQDRVSLGGAGRPRFVEACEQAYHFGKGKLAVRFGDAGGAVRQFSNRFHCASCDIEYREPSAALFSFNHPLGACPACRGFGRIIDIDYQLAIPDRSRTLAGGAVKPWQSGHGLECQADLERVCRQKKIPMDVPFRDLPHPMQQWVIEGEPDYGKDARHEWPHAWYGVKGYFRWLESKAYKMHIRVLLSRYRAYSRCPSCDGRRFQPDALLFKVPWKDALLTLADFYRLPVDQALQFIASLAGEKAPGPRDPLRTVLHEVRARLAYLQEVGLGYLTLDRPTRSLSGGETERVNLTTCLGTRLVNTLYVLDEPSVGLHARDTARLVQILKALRDTGNTVLVVEHEREVMQAADHIVDLGPGQGEAGGEVVFEGSYSDLLRSDSSLTGAYLSGRRKVQLQLPKASRASAIRAQPALVLSGATKHNLRNLSVSIPLHRLVCLTGVSGSGKTTVVREILLPLLQARLEGNGGHAPPPDHTGDSESAEEEIDAERTERGQADSAPSLSGWEQLGRAVLVDQSPLGRTPRSNPVVYIGAFDHIRNLFAQTELARQRGLGASAFSFNSAQGQCERCRGAGFEKIEMQFLSDVFISCPECHGRRYRPHILEITIQPPGLAEVDDKKRSKSKKSAAGWNIADLLDATVDQAIHFLAEYGTPHAEKAVAALHVLQEIGLGYLRLGQPINTLSGGESQRLKLVSHLVSSPGSSAARSKPTLFLFDEPTTGLHFEDIRILLQVFRRLVNEGHSLVVIEHHLDVIRASDWVIDLGPEAGDDGGQVVVAGTPDAVAACAASHTGRALAGAYDHADRE